MKYSVNNYVDAFTQAAKETSYEKATEGFLKLLSKTGDIKHSKKILTAIHKKLVNEKGGKWVNVEVARESALKKETFKNKFTDKDYVDFSVNPNLVAGARITVNNEEELDNSLNNKLNKLFK